MTVILVLTKGAPKLSKNTVGRGKILPLFHNDQRAFSLTLSRLRHWLLPTTKPGKAFKSPLERKIRVSPPLAHTKLWLGRHLYRSSGWEFPHNCTEGLLDLVMRNIPAMDVIWWFGRSTLSPKKVHIYLRLKCMWSLVFGKFCKHAILFVSDHNPFRQCDPTSTYYWSTEQHHWIAISSRE